MNTRCFSGTRASAEKIARQCRAALQRDRAAAGVPSCRTLRTNLFGVERAQRPLEVALALPVSVCPSSSSNPVLVDLKGARSSPLGFDRLKKDRLGSPGRWSAPPTRHILRAARTCFRRPRRSESPSHAPELGFRSANAATPDRLEPPRSSSRRRARALDLARRFALVRV